MAKKEKKGKKKAEENNKKRLQNLTKNSKTIPITLEDYISLKAELRRTTLGGGFKVYCEKIIKTPIKESVEFWDNKLQQFKIREIK